jgi:prepilin-type N-terminal cleavage/methylation domain-containing protein
MGESYPVPCDSCKHSAVALKGRTRRAGFAMITVVTPRTRRAGRHGFSLIETMIVVAILAILASTAAVQYGRYLRRAKTAEVYESLTRITLGARSYFLLERMDSGGAPINRQFPQASLQPTTACCQRPAAKCLGTWTSWTGSGWQALHFILQGPHYYQYEVTRSGSNKTAAFSAFAYGNLDCDAQTATWQVTGSIDSDFRPIDTGVVRQTNVEIE